MTLVLFFSGHCIDARSEEIFQHAKGILPSIFSSFAK